MRTLLYCRHLEERDYLVDLEIEGDNIKMHLREVLCKSGE